MTYWRLHYHLIWATFEREPSITPEHEKVFYGVLYNKAKELGVKIHAAGNIDDHAHVVASIPPKLAVADCVRQLKGASSYAINHMEGSGGKFKWQGGYGALSIGERSLETVKEYAAKQKEHHRENKIIEVYERMEEDDARSATRIRPTKFAPHAGAKQSSGCCGCSMNWSSAMKREL